MNATETKVLRPLHKIADEMYEDLIARPASFSKEATMECVTGLRRMTTCAENFGAETGDMVVAYCHSRSAQLKGPRMLGLRKELEAHLHAFNHDRNYKTEA